MSVHNRISALALACACLFGCASEPAEPPPRPASAREPIDLTGTGQAPYASFPSQQAQVDDLKLSLDVAHTDLQEVVEQVANITGNEIYVDPQVHVEVSLEVRDMSLRELLETIASDYGLSLREEPEGVFLFHRP